MLEMIRNCIRSLAIGGQRTRTFHSRLGRKGKDHERYVFAVGSCWVSLCGHLTMRIAEMCLARLLDSVEMLAEGDGEPDGTVPIEASAGKAVIV